MEPRGRVIDSFSLDSLSNLKNLRSLDIILESLDLYKDYIS